MLSDIDIDDVDDDNIHIDDTDDIDHDLDMEPLTMMNVLTMHMMPKMADLMLFNSNY